MLPNCLEDISQRKVRWEWREWRAELNLRMGCPEDVSHDKPVLDSVERLCAQDGRLYADLVRAPDLGRQFAQVDGRRGLTLREGRGRVF